MPISIDIPSTSQETSFFGSLTAHLGPDTELSGGLRHIIAINQDSTTITQETGVVSTGPNSVFLLPGSLIQSLSRRQTHRPTIYNVSLSHHFSRDLLVYANTGSSWRVGPEQVGLFNKAADPTLNSLIFLNPETSRSYEIGLKSTFLDGRARLNVALYRQKFHNLIFRTATVPYLSTSSSASVSTTNLTTNADAVVEGFDIDSAFQITRDWTVSAALSYSDGRVDNDVIPCRDANFDGVPDAGTPTVAQFQAAGTAVAMCHSNGSVSQNPLWNLSLQSEYVHEVTDGVDGFVRGLLTYYPKNNRQTPALVINNYSLLNLYAGVRSHDGAWEVSLFAKNAFNTNEVLDQDASPISLGSTQAVFAAQIPLDAGYFKSVSTREREVGVNVRYAFGSR